MSKFALQLAFVVAALWFLYGKFAESLGQPPIPFVDLAMYIPAVLLGAWYWCKGRSFASSWPVVTCVILVWVGVAYADNTESDRGLLIAALLTIVLPVAALIVEKRAWLMCAKTYVIANAAAMVIALWYETQGELVNTWNALYRFGFLWANDGVTQLSNPNQVGGQFAFASVISFIIYLKGFSREKRAGGIASQKGTSPSRPVRTGGGMLGADLYLGIAVFLAVGCMLTASRGAAASWLVGMGILTIWGTRAQSLARQKGLAFLMVAGTLMAAFAVMASGYSPWENLGKRLEARSVTSLGNRAELWRDAFIAWTSDPDYIFRGVGTGMADELVGAFTIGAEEDDYGVLRKNCHNVFVELILSFGLVGIACGTALFASMFHKALILDAGERNVARLAILLTAVVFAMTAVSYRQSCWLANGSLMLAMVSGKPTRRRVGGTSTSKTSTDVERPRLIRADCGGLARGPHREEPDFVRKDPHYVESEQRGL